IQDSDSFRHFLDVQSRFHQYSWGNVALIMAQRPDASRVAGYRTWQSMGRQVVRGEKAIKIVVPHFKRDEEAPDDPERRKVYFSIGNVFDVSQTEGEPIPTYEVPVLKEEGGRELFDELAHIAAKQEGLTVRMMMPREELPERMGFYDPHTKTIAIRHQVPQLQRTKTLAHEMAHYFIGHSETYHEIRDEHETIAEAVAYVTLGHFG